MKRVFAVICFAGLMLSGCVIPCMYVFIRNTQQAPIKFFDWLIIAWLMLSCVGGAVSVMIEGQRK